MAKVCKRNGKYVRRKEVHTMKKYDSASIELEKDRRVTEISRQYPNEGLMFAAARRAGMSIGEYDTWHTAATFIAVRELKREIPAEFHPAWFGRY